MKEVKYFCDKCGKEFNPINRPPWYPELCSEHLAEYLEMMQKHSTYTWKEDPNNPIRVWL